MKKRKKGAMRKLIQKKAVILTLITSVILSGCSNGSEDKMKNVDATKTKWESETLDKNLSADLDVTEELPKQIYTYKVESTNFSVKEAKKIFFPKDKGKEKYNVEYDEDNDKKEELTTDTGLDLISTIEGFLGDTEEYKYLSTALHAEEVPEDYDYEGEIWTWVGEDKELPNLSKKTVEEKITNQLGEVWKDIGISISQMHIRAYTPEYLNKLTKKAVEDSKEKDNIRSDKFNAKYTKEWKENEGVYYIRVEFSMDGILLNPKDHDENITDGVKPETFYAEFWYNEEGCIKADFKYFKILKKDKIENVPVSYAVEAVKNNITSVILSDEQSYEMNDVTFCYTWVYGEEKEYSKAAIKPVWIINVKYSDQELDGVNDKYFVDAVTGEVMEQK